jgi:hypothetical protein
VLDTDEARYVIEQTGAKLILFHSERRAVVELLQDLFTLDKMFLVSADYNLSADR